MWRWQVPCERCSTRAWLRVAATTHATTRVLLSHQHRNRLPTESVDRWDARDEYMWLFSAAASDQGLTLMQLSREPPVASAAEGEGGFTFSDTGSVRLGSAFKWSPDLSVIEVQLRSHGS